MTELTVVHMVRHAEVDNPAGVLYGRREGYHLTSLGRNMAGELAGYFAGHDVRAIISSPLERAYETAEPTAKQLGLPILSDERLIEAGNRFEGVNVNRNRMILAHPRYWSWYRNPFTPSWGEPYTDIVDRFSGAIRHALTLAEGERQSSFRTSCRFGRCAASSNGARWRTIRGAGSARYVR
ncbi:histidine phosphatase family protein [Actinobaculum sp. 313]|uniref:histidine phosphatase family protein n=1 Tax=Actinobaculum sp. 313 TaxID=2495645 RepID=UPI003204F239